MPDLSFLLFYFEGKQNRSSSFLELNDKILFYINKGTKTLNTPKAVIKVEIYIYSFLFHFKKN